MNEAAPAPGALPVASAGPTASHPAFGIGQDGTYTRTGQVLAFLAGLWTMVLFFPLLFVGAILYTKAEEVFKDDPARARKLVSWSWLSVTVAPVLAVAVVIAATLPFR
ncbi:hypothetical protein [Actinomadura rugatobispora]|uniref:CD225/dispanin family protein n=1 Tax=Actinomadura rugatobispora TaxID=1994 RepID=A0ABW1A1L6_9ACTN|nr:hypothetical protein GCM10010200_016110 [Actinomadura rugatobispora]